MLGERTLKVFTPYGRKAGSSRVRVFEWIDHLQLKATVHAFTDGNAAGFRELSRHPVASIRRHRELAATEVNPDDIVLIHREIGPLSDGSAEERLLRAGAMGIVDLDDGIQWDWGLGGVARRVRPKAPKVLRMVQAADLVIAGNDVIAEWASQHSPRVVVIPSCVDPAKYKAKAGYDLRDPPVVGWIGSAATEKHLVTMAGSLLRSHKFHGTRLELIGSPVAQLGELETMVTRIPWSEQVAYDLPSTWDAAVMPLPDGLLERSKCGYKLLQYGAAGVPSVGSPVGVNAEICSDTLSPQTGDALEALLMSSVESRRSAARRIADLVRSRFSFASNRSRYLSALGGEGPGFDQRIAQISFGRESSSVDR